MIRHLENQKEKMKTNLLLNFNIDQEHLKIMIDREFNAELKTVWAAWTESQYLDQWWAPKPWKARTKLMDFRAGGHWLYAMVGPDGTEHWGRTNYLKIETNKSYTGEDVFCDSDGVVNTEFPTSIFDTEFSYSNNKSLVHIEVTLSSIEHLEQYISMGFKEGFISALENLDTLLES